MEEMSKVRQVTEDLKDRLFVEMANVYNDESGIHSNYVIYISTKQGSHGARVKVYKEGFVGRTYPCIVLSIEQEPQVKEDFGLKIKSKELAEIKYWVSINRVVLLKLWNSNSENVSIGRILKELIKVDK